MGRRIQIQNVGKADIIGTEKKDINRYAHRIPDTYRKIDLGRSNMRRQ